MPLQTDDFIKVILDQAALIAILNQGWNDERKATERLLQEVTALRGQLKVATGGSGEEPKGEG